MVTLEEMQNEDQHGGYGYGVRNKERERILEFCAVSSDITKIRSGWTKFRDLVWFLASRDLPLGAKCRLYSAFRIALTFYAPISQNGETHSNNSSANCRRIV